MTAITFIAEEAPEGGYTARAVGHSIFTEADSLDELRAMMRDAVRGFFEPDERPTLIHLHLVKDELIQV